MVTFGTIIIFSIKLTESVKGNRLSIKDILFYVSIDPRYILYFPNMYQTIINVDFFKGC